MKYSELLSLVFTNVETNAPAKVVKDVIDTMILCITDEVAAGGDVSLPDLGKFSRGHRDARQGRNPQTGDAVAIPERNTVKFKPASRFKKLVNGEE